MAYLKVVNENGTKRLIDYSKAPQYNKLAVNEPTTTASQSYTKGEYLTQGGYFKKVTNAIASGGTISSSNTEDTTVGNELTQINSDLSNLITVSSIYTEIVSCTQGIGNQYGGATGYFNAANIQKHTTNAIIIPYGCAYSTHDGNMASMEIWRETSTEFGVYVRCAISGNVTVRWRELVINLPS